MSPSRNAFAVTAYLLCVIFPGSHAADREDARPTAVGEASGVVPKPLTIFTPDRKLSAILSADGVIEIHSADGTLVRKFHQCSPIAAVFSADGTLLCSAGRPQSGITSLKVWRLTDLKLLFDFTSNTEDIPIMAFSAKNDLLASTTGRTRVDLLEIPQGKLRWSASVNRRIASVAFEERAVVVEYANGKSKRLAAVDGKLLLK